MNEEYQNKIISDYELALESTPEEVRDFLWSDTYKKIVDGIVKTCNLTPSQGEVVSRVLFDLTINATDNIAARSRLSGAGVSEINQETIFNLGYEFIINPSINEAEETINFTETNVPLEETREDTETPHRNDPLANLAARLTQPSAIAPSKRDYSITAASAPVDTTPVQKTFDPYRELPEK